MPEILLYSDIAPGDAGAFRQQLSAAGAAPTVRINSPGGSVFDGLAIANAIQAHGRVRVVVDGLAASIASLIAIAGSRVEMARNALLMIHEPWMGSGGTAEALRRDAAALDKARETMIGAYAAKTKKTPAEIAALMAAETWYTAAEALAAGFVDAVAAPVPMAASLDLSRFTNLPERIRLMSTDPQTPDPQTAQAATQPAGSAPKAEAGSRRAMEARTHELRSALGPLMQPGMPHAGVVRDEYIRALEDQTVSVDAVRQRVLSRLGEASMVPLGYVHNTRPGDTTDYGHVIVGRNAHHSDFKSAAIDALLMRGQVPVSKPHPGARDLRGMTLVGMAEVLLSQRGQGAASSALGTIRAAMTTSDFPSLLADTAGKALMRGYESEPGSHRVWTREATARDFKTQSRVALSEAPELLKKSEAGEYQAGSLSDRGESFKLVTFGRVLVISREAMINDDLQGFTRIPMAFGAAAVRKEADEVYGLLLSNPDMSDGKALFSEDHGNLMDAGALDVSGLTTARAAMRRQKGPNGGYLNPVPRFLIVPAALETTALQLVAAETIKRTSPDAMNTDAPQLQWVRALEVVVDPRLDDDDPDAWYLAAHHEQIDTFERVFLEQQRGVFTEEDTEFMTDNFRLKARLDFAAAAIDWSGLSKTPGA